MRNKKSSTFLGREMSPLGLLWLFLLQHTGAALEYILFTHSARMGSNTTIPCKFEVNAVLPAQRNFLVLWHFQEKEIFRYPNNPKAINSRLSIDQDRIKDGIADLYMSGVSISDGGLYKCSMVQIPGEKEKEIRLDVYAPPQITITGKNVIKTKQNVLSCAISGFYPVDIDIKWLRDGIILNNITLEKPQRDPDGMYSVRSSVTITPTEEDRKRIFSCRIQHESLTAPLQEDLQLVFGDATDMESSTLYTIIITVIAAVVILIIAVAIFWYKRKGKNNHNKVKDLENQEEKLMPSNQQGFTSFPCQPIKTAGDPSTERSRREDVSAREGTRLEEDPLPKEPQDRNKNIKSVTERSNNQDKSLINDESSEAALPRPAHRQIGISHRVLERQESCSERSGNQQAPLYNAVLIASLPGHQTSATGLEPASAATHCNSRTVSPQGTKELRPSLYMQTRDSGRGQAAQQQKIGNQGGVNSAKSATEDWSRDFLNSPGYQKTTSSESRLTSPALAISPEPRATKLSTDKKTKPLNHENSGYITVADRIKHLEAVQKK